MNFQPKNSPLKKFFLNSGILVRNTGIACNDSMARVWIFLNYQKVNNIKPAKNQRETIKSFLNF